MTCLDENKFNNGGNKNNNQKIRESIHCLDLNVVINLRKCVYSHVQAPRNKSGCLCSEVESCLTPVQLPRRRWVEITYSSLECHNHNRSLSSDSKHSSSRERSVSSKSIGETSHMCLPCLHGTCSYE